MSGATEFDDLADMAVKVRKSLHWCAFLLVCMVLIVAIDLQLARSIARQAVALSELIARNTAIVRGGDGPEPVDTPADDVDHPGRGGGDHVDGSPRVAEGNHQASNPVPAAPAGRPRSPRKRAPGDGPGTARDTGA